MNSASTQFVHSRRMDIYEPIHQMKMWGDFKENNCIDASPLMILQFEKKLDNQSKDTLLGVVGASSEYEQEPRRTADKLQAVKRLAQNREAARKSRMRKKAYVQQLESSKLKLIELEQELDRAKHQNLRVAGCSYTSQMMNHSGNRNPGIITFEKEYCHWVEEQDRQISELRNSLHADIGVVELDNLVELCIRHYFDLFTMKEAAARADVFYLMSGMWRTTTERFFLWIGGFRPSELIKVLLPHLEPLSEAQLREVDNLRQSCQQAEDALTQGIDKLHFILSETIVAGTLGEGNCFPQVNAAMDKLEALVRFLGQADYLRRETLQQIARMLDTRQAARGLLALGEYLQRIRALSTLWSLRPA